MTIIMTPAIAPPTTAPIGIQTGGASHLMVTLFMVSIEESSAGYNVELLHSPNGSQDSTHTPLITRCIDA